MKQTLTYALIAGLSFTTVAIGEPKPTVDAPREKQMEKGKVVLRPKFEKGQVVKYVMKQRSVQHVPNPEDPKTPYEVKNSQDIGLKLVTRSVDAATGEATVEMVYETVKVVMDSELAKIEYDSTKPKKPAPKKDPKDPFAQIGGFDLDQILIGQYEKMVGTSITMTVDKAGRITALSGGDALAPAGLPIAGLGAGSSTPGKEVLQGLFGPIVSKSGFEGFADVGDKWKNDDGLSTGPLGNLSIVTEYELKSNRGYVAEIGFRGRVEPKSLGEGGGSPFQIHEAGHSGRYSWDTRLGQLIAMNMDQNVTLSAQATGGAKCTNTTTVSFERVGGSGRIR